MNIQELINIIRDYNEHGYVPDNIVDNMLLDEDFIPGEVYDGDALIVFWHKQIVQAFNIIHNTTIDYNHIKVRI
jgi:hypothetical protein